MGQSAALRDEIIRCGRDPVHFIRSYVKIRHPQRGIIPFDLWDFQAKLLESYVQNRFNVVLKARQLGVTEATAAFAAWLVLFHRDKSVLIIATKAEVAKNMIKKVKIAIAKIPRWLRLVDATTDNIFSIEFQNGSSVKAVASAADAGRSESPSLLIVDEGAIIKNMDELWTSLMPAVSVGGRIIMVSTPFGVGNVFHRTFTEGQKGLNGFKTTELPWWVHPEHVWDLEDDPDRPGFKTSTWFKRETAGISPRARGQEYECSFATSGDTLIDGDILLRLGSEVVPPLAVENWDRLLWVWERPVPGATYILSADVARGDGHDHSAFHVINVDTMAQVAEYDGRLPTDEFAQLLCDVGEAYNRALLVVENNSVGLACLEHIKLAKYRNVYYSRRDDHRPGEGADSAYGPPSSEMVIGFTTSVRTRPLVIHKFEEYVRLRTILLRSSRLHAQCLTFVWKGNRPEAARGAKDDLVMAAALGVWIRDTVFAGRGYDPEAQTALVRNISMVQRMNHEIPGASKNPTFAPAATMGAFGGVRDPFTLVVGRSRINLRELLS